MFKHLTHLTAALFLLFVSLSAQTDSWPCGVDSSDALGNPFTCTKVGDTLKVGGFGRMRDYSMTGVGPNTPWGQVRYVVIGEGVTYIGSNAFGNSFDLKEVTVFAADPPTFHEEVMGPAAYGNGAFPGAITSAILRVPQNSINTYRSANVWKDFGYINPSTVTFLNGNMTYETQLVSYGDTVTKPADPFYPVETPVEVFFDGWYKQGEEAIPYIFSTPVTTDITLLAKWGTTTSATSPDRVVPQDKPTNENATLAPVSTSASGFTVGPNPAIKSSGGVAFFRQGTLIINASLSVYNASGNVVRALSIRDNAVGTQSKRRVGSWDLKDANGRLVPGGTYLVKGTITAAGGKNQSVSAPVGVK